MKNYTKRLLIPILILILTPLLLISCKKNSTDRKNEVIIKKIQQDKTLTLYNWEEYIGSDTIENFYTTTGIKVIEKNYKDEEIMMGMLQSDLKSYDLVVASDDLLKEMIKSRMLAPLDHTKITNIKHLAKTFLNITADPDRTYSLPYLWGTTGLLINTKYIKNHNNSWKVLFREAYKNKTALLNNPFEAFAIIAKISGDSINVTDTEKITGYGAYLNATKNNLRGFLDVITIQEMMINEELWAAQIYSGEGLVAVDTNENLEYIIPVEGSSIWIDNFVIPRDARNKDEAHTFINYILDPVVNAKIASELWYATANETAKQYMDTEVVNSSAVYPTVEILKRCEFFEDIGETNFLYTSLWNTIQLQEQ